MYYFFVCGRSRRLVFTHPPPPPRSLLSLFYPFPPPPSKRHKWMNPMLFVLLDKEVAEELVDKID